MRWPLYPIQVIACIAVLFLTFQTVKLKVSGYRQVPVVAPWIFLNLIYSLTLCFLALRAHGDIPPSAPLAIMGNALHFAGLTSIAALLVMRIWNRG